MAEPPFQHMSIYQNNLFLYLDSERIAIDKAEFAFQAQSHPEFPSLLATSDTLEFFNIEHGAIPVAASEIDSLPNRFLALLSNGNRPAALCYVEKRGNKYFCSGTKAELVSRLELDKRWRGVVILVEKSN